MSGERDPIDDFNKINNELKSYDELVSNKKMIVVCSKMDEDGAYERKEQFDKALGIESIGISALTHEGLKELIYKIVQTLKEEPEENISFVQKEETKFMTLQKMLKKYLYLNMKNPISGELKAKVCLEHIILLIFLQMKVY